MFRSDKYYEKKKKDGKGSKGVQGDVVCNLYKGGFDRPNLQNDVRAET